MMPIYAATSRAIYFLIKHSVSKHYSCIEVLGSPSFSSITLLRIFSLNLQMSPPDYAGPEVVIGQVKEEGIGQKKQNKSDVDDKRSD